MYKCIQQTLIHWNIQYTIFQTQVHSTPVDDLKNDSKQTHWTLTTTTSKKKKEERKNHGKTGYNRPKHEDNP